MTPPPLFRQIEVARGNFNLPETKFQEIRLIIYHAVSDLYDKVGATLDVSKDLARDEFVRKEVVG